MRRALFALALALPLLTACQLSLPGRDAPAAAGESPVTAGSITTTTLDAAPIPPPDPTLAASPAPAAATSEAPPLPPAPTTAATETAAPAPAPPAPVASKSAAQIACEEDGGTWARAGEGGGMACVRPTRDGGRQCDRKSDCQGECLARSRTCAPIRPLFGCNAVLMDNGAEVSLCID